MKKRIRERIAETAEIPKDFMMNLPRLLLLGDKEIQVDNYRGLLEYSSETIRLSADGKQIVITGFGLGITRLLENTVFVSGNITGIEFCTLNKKGKNQQKIGF